MKNRILIVIFLQIGFCFSQQESVIDGYLKNGVAAYSKGNYEQAIVLFKKCVVLSKQAGDTKSLGYAYNDLGNSYTRTGKSELALTNFLLSAKIFKQNEDNFNLAKAHKDIGALYSEQKDFVSAMQNYTTAFETAKKIENEVLMADCLNNMGVVYEQELKYDRALAVYARALKIYKAEGDENKISMVLNNLAIVYKCLKNYPQSIQYYKEALVLSDKLEDKFMVAANQNNLGNVYILTGDYQKSLALCLLAYKNAKAIQAQEIIIESCDGIATAYEKLNQFANAIAYRKMYELENRNFINEQRSTQLAEMQVKYETEKKLAEIKLLQQEGKIRNLKIQEQHFKIARKNRLIIGFAFLFLCLLSTAYFWRSRQKLKAQLVHEKIIKETEETERIRMAKDIHDDLGSGLSKINFLSEIISQKAKEYPEIKNSTDSIKETAKRMIDNMRDLIWALNPENATLANLVARMREYTTDYLEDYAIEIVYSIPDTIPQIAIKSEIHRGLFLVVKEAVNNISKHAKASIIDFNLSISDEDLTLFINDNGIGFENQDSDGNGLKNMQSRIEEIGGSLSVNSKVAVGTEVKIKIKLATIFKK